MQSRILCADIDHIVDIRLVYRIVRCFLIGQEISVHYIAPHFSEPLPGIWSAYGLVVIVVVCHMRDVVGQGGGYIVVERASGQHQVVLP